MAKRKQRNELKAGIFVILALVVLFGTVLWLGVADLFKSSHQTVHFAVDESAGAMNVSVGSRVKIVDAVVGEITEVRFDPDTGQCVYVAQIQDPDIQLHADAKATLSPDLLGTKHVVLTSRGTDQAPLAGPDQPIAIGGGLDQALANLADKLQSIADLVGNELDPAKPDSMLARIKTELSQENPDSMLAQMKRILDDLEKAGGDVSQITGTARDEFSRERQQSLLVKVLTAADNIATLTANLKAETDPARKDALIARLHATMAEVKAIVAEVRPKIRSVMDSAERIAKKFEGYTDKEMAELLGQLRDVNDRVLKIAGDIGTLTGEAKQMVTINRGSIDEMIDNMVSVSANLKAASKELRRNPWRLLYQPTQEELDSANIREATRAFSEGAEQLDQALTKLKALSKLYPDGIPSDDPKLQVISESIKRSFKNFQEVENALWEEIE